MKSFILKFSIFALAILILFFPLDLLLSAGLRKSKTIVDGEYLVWNDIYNGRINDDILVYGGSRAMVHFDPEIIEDSLNRTCYNMGVNGLEFLHQYVRHREFMKYNKPPAFIIVSLDGYSFQSGRNLFNEDQFLPYLLGNNNFRKYLHKVNSFNYFDYYTPLIRYYGRRDAIKRGIRGVLLGEETISNRTKGYIGRELEWNDDFGNAMASLGFYEIKFDSIVLGLFNDFLVESKANDIELIFVYTPEYIGVEDFVINREEGIKKIKEFSKEFDIPFLDYSKDEICYNKDYFYNALHLNKTGATKFTKKLTMDLKKTNLGNGTSP